MPTGVYPRTEYHKRINSEGHKGRKLSDAHKKKLSKIAKGRKISDEQKEKLRRSALERGIRPSKECSLKAAEASRLISGEKHYGWKGDAVGYVALHAWVSRQKGRPKHCEHCKKSGNGKYEWANKDNKYRRHVDDFIRLCVECHRNYDLNLRKTLCKKTR